MSTTRRPLKQTIIAVVAAAVSFASCGSSDSAADTTAPGRDQRIVSLSPTATEMLYAIGAGDQIVAVDSLSTYPAEVAPKVTKISAYEPSAEAILGYEPDVVIISNDMNKISEQLTAANPGITMWTGAAASTIEDVYTQITQLGELTGHEVDASELIESMKERITAATKKYVGSPASGSYYYELDNTFYSITSNTFIGALLKPFGLTNIADGVEEGNDYPQLNAESIVKANPTIIFLADTKCCQQSAQTVAARAGWSSIDAVKNGNVVELDDDVASRWGPRIVDLVEAFSVAVAKSVVG